MLTAKCEASSNTGRFGELAISDQSTIGGSSESELKELTVMPAGELSARSAVITVTPVANAPKAWRSARVGSEIVLSIKKAVPIY